MVRLKEICYVRLGTRDLDSTSAFATKILGLQPAGVTRTERYFRSDSRSHTLYYFYGDPGDQVVGFEVADCTSLDDAGAELERLGHPFRRGTRAECESRRVGDFIQFKEPNGTSIDMVVRPELSGDRYYGTRDAGIASFSHIGLFTRNPVSDEIFWTGTCGARVSDRIGNIPLLRISAIHHTLALLPAQRSGVQHINYQVVSTDDIMRSVSVLKQHCVPIVFGPGCHPTSSARFLYFEGPDGMIFEYSVGVSEINEEHYRERQFSFEPTSLCMWGSKTTASELQL